MRVQYLKVETIGDFMFLFLICQLIRLGIHGETISITRENIGNRIFN